MASTLALVSLSVGLSVGVIAGVIVRVSRHSHFVSVSWRYGVGVSFI